MTSDGMKDSLRHWVNEELPYISPHSLLLNDTTLDKLCIFKSKEVMSFIVKYVRPRSTTAAIRAQVKTFKNWATMTKDLQLESNLSKTMTKDSLVQKLCSLSNKETYLGRRIYELENELTHFNADLKNMKSCLQKDKHVCSVTNQFHHLMKEKVRMFQSQTNELCSLSQQKFDQTTTPVTVLSCDLNCVQYKSSAISLTKLYNPQSFLDIQTTLSIVQGILKEMAEDNECDIENCKQKLWCNIKDILHFYVSSDILLCFQNENYQDAQLCIFDPLINEHNFVSTFSSVNEILKLKKQCIKYFMDSKALEKNEILKQRSEISSYVNELNISTYTKKLLTQLLDINSKVDISIAASNCLQQILLKIDTETRLLHHLFVIDESTVNKKINLKKIEITRQSNQINGFLRQNKFFLSDIPKKQESLCKTTGNFLCNEQLLLTSIVQNLDYNSFLEENLLSLGQALDNRHLTHRTERQSLYDVGLKSFQHECVLLNKIVELKLCNREQEILSRLKTLDKIKRCEDSSSASVIESICETQRNEEKQMLGHLVPKIAEGIELHNTTALLSRIDDNLHDWWIQPAQFIPEIMVNSLTLKQFMNFVESKPS